MEHQGRPPRGNFAVTKEEKKKVRGLKNTLALLKMAHLPKSAYAKVIIFYILSMLASVAVSLIDVQLVLAITSTSLDFFVQLVIIGFITLIFNEIISRINTIVDLKFQNMIVKEIDKVNYNQIFNLKIADFDQKSSAEFETRVHSAQNISDLLVSLLSTIHRVIKNLSYCIVILIRVPILSLVSFVFGLINTLCLRALRPKTLALSHKNWMENGVPMDSLSREALYGIRDIKGLDIGDEIKRQYNKKDT
jgi:ABC-type bacteriocin/lantibiotic exporter with double-glycine peptidase domain